MKKFDVSFLQNVTQTVVVTVEADTEEKAIELVKSGNLDYFINEEVVDETLVDIEDYSYEAREL